jgi:hypothetical protein
MDMGTIPETPVRKNLTPTRKIVSTQIRPDLSLGFSPEQRIGSASPIVADSGNVTLAGMDEDEQVKSHLDSLIFLGSVEQEIIMEHHESERAADNRQLRLLSLRGRIAWEKRSIQEMQRKRGLGS